MTVISNDKRGKSERGAVALLTAIIISILLTIVVTSMVGLSIGEQRQSTDADQSIRAYYAAEAGVEDGLQQVKTYLGGGALPAAGCSSAPVGPSVSYTCKQVSVMTNHLTGSRNVEEAEQLEPGVASTYNQMVIRWHQYGTDPDVVPSGYIGPSGSFTPRTSWDFPAVIELTALRYNSTGTLSPADPTNATGSGITVQTIAISPGSGPPSTINFNVPPGPFAKQADGRCTSNVTSNFGYNCQATLSFLTASPAANTYVFRIRPRYAGTHYQVEFNNSGGPALNVADQNATVDVTAQAGDVFRRIEAKVPIKAGVASGLDFVLFSDTDICKDFTVVSGVATPQTCPLP